MRDTIHALCEACGPAESLATHHGHNPFSPYSAVFSTKLDVLGFCPVCVATTLHDRQSGAISGPVFRVAARYYAADFDSRSMLGSVACNCGRQAMRGHLRAWLAATPCRRRRRHRCRPPSPKCSRAWSISFEKKCLQSIGGDGAFCSGRQGPWPNSQKNGPA